MYIRKRMGVFILLLASASVIATENEAFKTLRDSSRAFAKVAREVSPSVVFIQVEKIRSTNLQYFDSPFGNDFFERFFTEPFPRFEIPNTPKNKRSLSQGSGFIFAIKDRLLSDRSFILTNNHVIEDANKIRVTLNSGVEFDAKVVGADPRSDIAVLSIDTIEVNTVTLGDSSALEVGEWVVAIGNPFGLNHSLTVGVVSAKGLTSLGITDYEDFIQTDAAINPGNSGGPLVNLYAEVIAMNTAIFTNNGGYMGVGFAISINLAKNIADQLINDGEVTRGYLGVVVQDLTKELAESFELDNYQGILIAQVAEDSPAEKAGLKEGDVIDFKL